MGKPTITRSKALNVIYFRRQGNYDRVWPALAELVSWCSKHGVRVSSPEIVIYHDEPREFGIGLLWSTPKADECRYWICLQVDGEVPKDQTVKELSLRSATVASLLYSGRRGGLDLRSIYRKLKEYTTENDFTVGGPVSAVLHKYSVLGGPRSSVLVEFQVPIFALPGIDVGKQVAGYCVARHSTPCSRGAAGTVRTPV